MIWNLAHRKIPPHIKVSVQAFICSGKKPETKYISIGRGMAE